ncbi:hypothetical protein [Spirosoma utsteinense]|nr:hypothetical protein [Spirosoma utsteinense]MBC3785475.1 hypothetical protein [Spirosoma utsteinense]
MARLQARMEQRDVKTRVVFWQNVTVQRYMAVAACLVLVCLFGWFYLSTETPTPGNDTVAANTIKAPIIRPQLEDRSLNSTDSNLVATKPIPDPTISNQSDIPLVEESVTEAERSVAYSKGNKSQRVAKQKKSFPEAEKVQPEMPVPASTKLSDQLAKTEQRPVSVEATDDKIVTSPTPAVSTERVLVVTIAEPEALIGARKTAKRVLSGEELDNSLDNKPEKDTKAAALWQQVKRIKQGEIFARKDAVDDERGLIGRAYSGLKQTLDKDKSIKQ